MIIADDLRPSLGCYGDPQARTPALDRLASEGAIFRRAFVSQAWCAPSRTAVLTGLRPGTTRVYDLETHFRAQCPEALTLPQYFRRHGYETAALGKVFHETNDDPRSWTEQTWVPAAPAYLLPDHQRQAGERRGYATPVEAADVDDDAYADGMVASEAIRRLETLRRAGRPFFLCVGFIRPHLPFAAPKKYWDLYRRDKIALAPRDKPPEGAPDSAFLRWAEHHNYTGIPRIPAPAPLPAEISRELIHGYLACTSYIDAQVGRLTAALESLGLAEETLVVFWGDHGWKLGEFGQWSKNSNFDIDTRVPLIMRGPGVKTGDHSTFVEMIDLFPTLVELTGLPEHSDVEGVSFAALTRGERSFHKDAAYSEVIRNDERSYTTYARSTHAGQSVRTERFRLVRWARRDGSDVRLELYHASAPNGESVNLAGDPAYKDELEALLGLLDRNLAPPYPSAGPD